MAEILVADDEAAVRALVSRALEMHGHSVTLACDGGEALDLLQTKAFDLLLTDIVMPVMDGIALALKVSSDFPALPILMMTGYSAEKQRAHNLDMLIDDVIEKPFAIDALVKTVEKALKTPK